MPTRNKIQVFSISDPKWSCMIDAGVLGVDWATFSPDGRHVITSAEFNINYTIFSMVDKSVRTIECPKAAKDNLKFTIDGGLAIVGERKKFQDAISIINLKDWKLDTHFETETQDFKSIYLNKLGAVIALNDPLPKPQIVIYSIMGQKLAAIKDGIGCCWSPTSQFLAVSKALDFEIYNHITWTKIATCSASINAPNTVYEEQNGKFVFSQDKYTSYIESDDAPQISRARFSAQNTYASVVQGRSIQIYSMKNMRLSTVLFLKSPVKNIQWCPCDDRLIATTGNSNLYVWSEQGSMILQIPHIQFIARSVVWSPVGDSVVLFGKEKCALAYFVNQAKTPNSKKHPRSTKNTHDGIEAKLKNLNIINA